MFYSPERLTKLILFRMKSFKSLLVRELQRELGYRKIEYNSKDRKAALQEVRTRFLIFKCHSMSELTLSDIDYKNKMAISTPTYGPYDMD